MSDGVLEELDRDVCIDLLRATGVGRIAFVLDGYPVLFPVNYRLIEDGEVVRLLLQTRAGNVIDSADERVGIQIDGTDSDHGSGWSVLVRGRMHHLRDPALAELRDRLEPTSWVRDHDAWITIDAVEITGRRLRSADDTWPFDVRGYR
jgi:nitroimidazol reductase NimA-like FMN-containing flavoprotein (pyridoxamine 5'-phosphate oxidase superfamily)